MIIGMLGFAGSGKGTAGDVLESEFNFVKDAFANPLKDAVAAIFGWDRNLLEGSTEESRKWRESDDPWWDVRIKGMTPRYALQLMGTEAGRNVFHSDVWLYSLERRLKPMYDYVITDVRFPNEMKFIRELGGKIVRVRRGPEPEYYEDAVAINKQYDSHTVPQHLPLYPDVHYSEWAWIGYDNLIDLTIMNNGTKEELKQDLLASLDKLRQL
jgi:hypothetical protein